MNLDITQVMFGVRIPVTKPVPEFLLEVGEDGLRKLVNDHYNMLRESEISHLFPIDDNDFEKAKKNSSDFLIQICGGPAYFTQSRGAPQMVGRHAPFRIDAHARKVWLEMYKPLILKLKEKNITEASLQSLWNYLDIFSSWMVNTK